jgi:hypothetical protein
MCGRDMRGNNLQKKDRYDIMYQKAQQLGERTSKAIQTFGIEENQGNIITDHRQALRIWGKYIYKICKIRKIAQKILQLKQKRNWMKLTKDLLT